MTNNEIIKALVCCREFSDCEGCQYGYLRTGNGLCIYAMQKDALDLINRQQATINNLKAENRNSGQKILNQRKQLKACNEKIKEQQAEIEKLKSMQEISPEAKHLVNTKVDKVISLLNEVTKSQEQVKSEALKEFAERVKDKKFEIPVDAHSVGYLLGAEDIDDILEEMGCGE